MTLLVKENLVVVNRFKQILCCLAAVIFFSAPAMVFGQGDVDGLVAVGTAKSEAMANRMRVTLMIRARGADLEKAIEVLKERQRNAKIKMEKLGVIEDSIEFGSISTDRVNARPIPQMVINRPSRPGNNKRLKKMMKVKPPASVQVSVSADWETRC